MRRLRVCTSQVISSSAWDRPRGSVILLNLGKVSSEPVLLSRVFVRSDACRGMVRVAGPSTVACALAALERVTAAATSSSSRDCGRDEGDILGVVVLQHAVRGRRDTGGAESVSLWSTVGAPRDRSMVVGNAPRRRLPQFADA